MDHSQKLTNDTFREKENITKPPQIIALTVFEPVTNDMEIVAVGNKNSATVTKALDSTWFCQYLRPMKCVHDQGTEFTDFEFQELLQSYGVKYIAIT
jgi:hypothetical protein